MARKINNYLAKIKQQARILFLTWADTLRAGDGNRTRMTSLEGWGSTIELRPRGTCTVAYRLSHGAAAGPGRRDRSGLQPAEPIGLPRCGCAMSERGRLRVARRDVAQLG